MLERRRPDQEAFSSLPFGSDDPFSGPAGPGLATVAHGVFMEQIPVAGMSVGEIRRRFADRFDIDPRSVAQLDGRSADEQTVVRSGQVLMFIRQAGEKGCGLPSNAGVLPCLTVPPTGS
jgi:hypothetical protein